MSYVNTLKMFVRVHELASMSAAARDQRTSPAVAVAFIAHLWLMKTISPLSMHTKTRCHIPATRASTSPIGRIAIA